MLLIEISADQSEKLVFDYGQPITCDKLTNFGSRREDFTRLFNQASLTFCLGFSLSGVHCESPVSLVTSPSRNSVVRVPNTGI